ncbi:MAG: hypothetical protein EOP06_03205 [Proteobacteria bacterium]|nr:MAG: hypothetical protein EOP06_03205 [Pseudomonadota bacterium]
MIKNLGLLHGVRVEADGQRLEKVYGKNALGAYDDMTTTILINPESNIVISFETVKHESLHAKTQSRLKTHPGSLENVFATQIWRERGVIAPALDSEGESYKYIYQLDETKTFFRGSKFFAQLAKKASDQSSVSDSLQRFSQELKSTSHNLSAASLAILKEADAALEDDASWVEKSGYLRRESEVRPGTAHKIYLQLPRADGFPVILMFPAIPKVSELEADVEIRTKLKHLIRYGIKALNIYQLKTQKQ